MMMVHGTVLADFLLWKPGEAFALILGNPHLTLRMLEKIPLIGLD
jgi:hypothetical protein